MAEFRSIDGHLENAVILGDKYILPIALNVFLPVSINNHGTALIEHKNVPLFYATTKSDLVMCLEELRDDCFARKHWLTKSHEHKLQAVGFAGQEGLEPRPGCDPHGAKAMQNRPFKSSPASQHWICMERVEISTQTV